MVPIFHEFAFDLKKYLKMSIQSDAHKIVSSSNQRASQQIGFKLTFWFDKNVAIDEIRIFFFVTLAFR